MTTLQFWKCHGFGFVALHCCGLEGEALSGWFATSAITKKPFHLKFQCKHVAVSPGTLVPVTAGKRHQNIHLDRYGTGGLVLLKNSWRLFWALFCMIHCYFVSLFHANHENPLFCCIEGILSKVGSTLWSNRWVWIQNLLNLTNNQPLVPFFLKFKLWEYPKSNLVGTTSMCHCLIF